VCFFGVSLIAGPAPAICNIPADCPVGEVCRSGVCTRGLTAQTVDSEQATPSPAAQPANDPQAPLPASTTPPAFTNHEPIPTSARTAPPTPSPAERAEKARETFGAAGQIVFWGSTGAVVSGASSGYSDSSTTTSSSNVNLAGNLGFFLTDVLLLETSLQTWRQSDRTLTYYGFGLEVGLGIHMPVNTIVSLLPEIRVGGGWARYDYPVGSTSTDHDYNHLWGSIGLPFLIHLAPHLFIGAGPQIILYQSQVNTPNVSSYNTTRLTLQGMIGGWI